MPRSLSSFSIALFACAGAVAASAQTTPSAAPVCVHDESVQQRFLPVELMTGNPMTESRELVFAPVDRAYPFTDELPNGSLGGGEAAMKGPVAWVGEGRTTFEVYERTVPRATERVALTPDRTAIGRVHDTRFGNAINEGKFPVGQWSQGQSRDYNTVYVTARGRRNLVTTLVIEKLSCTYEGTPGAVQYGWSTSTGSKYGYIYAPGKGLVHVMTRVPSG